MSLRQLFDYLKDAQNNDLPGSNICLHYGRQHLPQSDDSRARMGYVDWQSGHPQIRLTLYPNSQVHILYQQHLPFVPFTICPTFSHSIISRDVATNFGLMIMNSLPQFCDISFFRVLYGMDVHLVSDITAEASIRIDYSDCCLGVQPVPIHQNRIYKFLVVDINSLPDWLQNNGAIIPARLAILGRDILNSMLLIYRGRLPAKIQGASEKGRLYFGADIKEL